MLPGQLNLLLFAVLLLASAATRLEELHQLRIAFPSIPTPERPVPPPAALFSGRLRRAEGQNVSPFGFRLVMVSDLQMIGAKVG
jgi:hypothetical protein